MIQLTGLGHILILIVANSNNQLVSQIRHRAARNLEKTQNNHKKMRGLLNSTHDMATVKQ